ncbi:MAG TPA: hypothetical protein VFB70_13645 [Pyrinomonadaceae bacterium]|nr:hypothetical protein [Pyrinomonadaceae bacterium]
MTKIFVATGFVLTLSLSVFAQTQSREDILKTIEAKRAELATLEKQFLSPSDEDRATHAEFLNQPDTGLIRLLPREKYDTETYKENKQSITLRGGGAYYSFARLTHEYGHGNDLELAKGTFSTAFSGGQSGSLVNLGDIPLETVSLETPAAQELASNVATRKKPQSQVPLKLNSTYLLRSVDSRSDVLVAFKVVRIDSDESAIILWKLLKKSPLTQGARNN